jgi:hypothetical protein
MQRLLLAIVFLAAPALCLADAGDTQVVEVWQCTIKEGKTADEVAAHNAKWLAFVRQTNADINSYGMERVVGESGSFMFADIYPDLQTWGAVKSALDSEAGEAFDQGFGELLDCESNQLYKSTQH